jgi:hypothetical protein
MAVLVGACKPCAAGREPGGAQAPGRRPAPGSAAHLSLALSMASHFLFWTWMCSRMSEMWRAMSSSSP